MTDFRSLIQTESKKLFQLHQAVHETFKTRDTSRSGYEVWKAACEQFHTHESALDAWIARCLQDSNLSDPDALEFCIQFLEGDPIFFRSGYIKEDLISRLKRTNLRKLESFRVHHICIAAVNRNGRREYRRYCQLAVSVRSDELMQELKQLSNSENGAIRSRAKMMLHILSSAVKVSAQHRKA